MASQCCHQDSTAKIKCHEPPGRSWNLLLELRLLLLLLLWSVLSKTSGSAPPCIGRPCELQTHDVKLSVTVEHTEYKSCLIKMDIDGTIIDARNR
jgi:hypothetical protein